MKRLIEKTMYKQIIPKLPMRNVSNTKEFYINQLGFKEIGDYGNYVLFEKGGIEIHFFEFKALNTKENYGQVYIRTEDIDEIYQALLESKILIHPNGHLETKPWGQREFALLDPDNNLLTFGQSA